MSAEDDAGLPPFYDDLDACRREAWARLAAGLSDRRSPSHTPTLATIGADGLPQARTVVLRAVDAEAGTLRFHCDRRSEKARVLAARPEAALHVYDRAAKMQVRLTGRAHLHVDDAVADGAWAAAMAMSRVCYGIDPAPGTALPAGNAYTLPDEGPDTEAGRPNFAAVVVQAERVEFLYLHRRGHRRATWQRGPDGWAGTWLAP